MTRGSSFHVEREPAGSAGPTPRAAAEVFGSRVAQTEAFVRALAVQGPLRGLIGPRELPRLWERHVLNSAVVSEGIPEGSSVVDLGSGAGLPGIPLALASPTLRVTLLEPMLRRVEWLLEITEALGLGDRVEVLRARGEEAPRAAWGVCVSRAVAPLDRLFPVAAPLVTDGGLVVALKGDRAAEELKGVAHRLGEWGLGEARVARFGERVLAEPTTAIVSTREGQGGRRGSSTVTGTPGRHRRLAGGGDAARAAGRRRST